MPDASRAHPLLGLLDWAGLCTLTSFVGALANIQLVANALWSWLFFAWRLGGVALAELVVFWLLIAVTTWSFGRLDRWAGLLLPYLAWVAFAGALNAVLWLSNPTLL